MTNHPTSTRSVPPRATAMLEALRGLGYSTGTALADIIDNSISAGATTVEVTFAWDGVASHVSVLDDGRGMDDTELESAMRLGEKSPTDARDASDLGRFGMGLKTASFSQCRRLTVASRKNGVLQCLRWDLDLIADRPDDGWLLFEGPAQGSEAFLDPLSQRSNGTLVLWETLDRIVTQGYTVQDFFDLVERVERHLAMVFHRLLQPPKPRLHLTINCQPVVPWDPFMSGHPSKPWNSPIARLVTNSGMVEVECHVLPHKDRLTAREYDQGTGPEGWAAQQGFYVYRNERLLVAGGWLGLGQGRAWNRDEAHRLARIRLDLPNTADADWKIDIRKSTARPPVSIRPWLTRLAEDTRARARRVFAWRGNPAMGDGGTPVEQAWRADQTRLGIRYRIDDSHPAVAAVIEAAGTSLPLVRAMLRVIEETVPVQRIWLDTAENRETPQTGFAGEPSENVIEVLEALFKDMIGRKGMSSAHAKQSLLKIEPFHNYPELVSKLPDDIA